MSYSWSITSDAVADLDRIEEYAYSYSADRGYAEDLVDAIEASFDQLCQNLLLHAVYQFPQGWEPAHEYRSVNVRRYKVFYRVNEARQTVLIYRICHIVSDFTRAGL